MFQAGCEVAVLHSGFVVFDNPGFKHNKLWWSTVCEQNNYNVSNEVNS